MESFFACDECKKPPLYPKSLGHITRAGLEPSTINVYKCGKIIIDGSVYGTMCVVQSVCVRFKLLYTK